MSSQSTAARRLQKSYNIPYQACLTLVQKVSKEAGQEMEKREQQELGRETNSEVLFRVASKYIKQEVKENGSHWRIIK